MDCPFWLTDGFAKDYMAAKCEETQRVPFLLTGRMPAAGQRIYAQITYEHDGSHPDEHRGWARMTGEVLEVLPPPPAGAFVLYPGQQQELSDEELASMRAQLPPLPPSIILRCQCGEPHSLERVMQEFGAVHGQALRARLRLSCDDEGCLEPQLAGDWDVLFVANDNKDCIWEIRTFRPVA